MYTQKKERDEMTGHDAREDMKEKKREEVCKGEQDEKGEQNGGDGNR